MKTTGTKAVELSLPEMTELVFENEGHIYKLHGLVIPSVSSILEPLSAARYQGIGTATLDNAANKGTEVHNAIENYIKFGIEDISPEHRGYFEGFLEWWRSKDIKVVGSELKVYHKVLRYGGTVDLLAFIDGKLTLVDFKTTYEISDMTCAVQLEGYSQALASHGIKVEQKIILHLKKDSKYKEHSYVACDADRWRVFGSLKHVYDYIQSSR